MNRTIAALAAAPLAALLLASCSTAAAGQLGNPAVSTMEPTAARDMAQQLCHDVESGGQKSAITKLATQLAGSDVTRADQDAIVDFAYTKLCPSAF